MDDLIVWIDRSIDEVLVNLGRLALRLASPQLTRSSEEREALARSVNQFSICANRSTDPRVQKLAQQLEGTVGPRLRLVAGPPSTNLGSCRKSSAPQSILSAAAERPL
jgi:hypothetical protein